MTSKNYGADSNPWSVWSERWRTYHHRSDLDWFVHRIRATPVIFSFITGLPVLGRDEAYADRRCHGQVGSALLQCKTTERRRWSPSNVYSAFWAAVAIGQPGFRGNRRRIYETKVLVT